jgi:phosphoribosylformylglycinamidine synthase II
MNVSMEHFAKVGNQSQIEGWCRHYKLRLTDYQLAEKALGRPLREAEIAILSTMWSEHCSYRHSKPFLKKLPTQGDCVLLGPGEGAGIVDIGAGYALAFKIESHNHPSAVDPFQGAATGVGGILRDIVSMGAKPVAFLNSLRFGEQTERLQQDRLRDVMRGIAHYGNCVGVPTVGGEIRIDDCFSDNPLVNAMCVGILKHEEIQTASKAQVGDILIYLGAATGRDGIAGASFASQSFEDGQAQAPQKTAIQIADPFIGKLLIDACLALYQTGWLRAIQDMGAAGITCASTELAHKSRLGVKLFLDQIPIRVEGMLPTDILLSETQERMMLAVPPENVERVLNLLSGFQVSSAVVGELVSGDQIEVFAQNTLVANMPLDVVCDFDLQPLPVKEIQESIWTSAHRSLPVEEVRKRTEMFDNSVQGHCVEPPHIDAAQLIYWEDPSVPRIAITVDGNEELLYRQGRVGMQKVVLEAALNLACAATRPLAITNGVNMGNPEESVVRKQLEDILSGLGDAARWLKIPITGGNVSLYNQTSGRNIKPSVMIGMVGIGDRKAVATHRFQQAGDQVYLVGVSSSWNHETVLRLIEALPVWWEKGLIVSAHDVGDVSLEVAVDECFQGTGLTLGLDKHPSSYPLNEGYAVLVSTRSVQWVEGDLKARGLDFVLLGQVV